MVFFRKPKIFTGQQTVSIQDANCIITLKTGSGIMNIQFDKETSNQLREMMHETDNKLIKYKLEKEYKMSVVFE